MVVVVGGDIPPTGIQCCLNVSIKNQSFSSSLVYHLPSSHMNLWKLAIVPVLISYSSTVRGCQVIHSQCFCTCSSGHCDASAHTDEVWSEATMFTTTGFFFFFCYLVCLIVAVLKKDYN